MVLTSYTLPIGTYAKFVPESGKFFEEVTSHKAVLETALRNHFALTRGDKIAVFYNDRFVLCIEL